jgi:hypothetical protein
MTATANPVADAILAAFTDSLVPADALTISQIARLVGCSRSDVELRFALDDLQARGLLHLYDRRWHTTVRPSRIAIYTGENA